MPSRFTLTLSESQVAELGRRFPGQSIKQQIYSALGFSLPERGGKREGAGRKNMSQLRQRNATINRTPVVVRSGYERGSEGYIVKINLRGDSQEQFGEEIAFAYSETEQEAKVRQRAIEEAKAKL